MNERINIKRKEIYLNALFFINNEFINNKIKEKVARKSSGKKTL
jgi:hypothetical protein